MLALEVRLVHILILKVEFAFLMNVMIGKIVLGMVIGVIQVQVTNSILGSSTIIGKCSADGVHTYQVYHLISASCNPDWLNEYAQGCEYYFNNNWCTSDGDYGPAWDMAWGTFDNNVQDGYVENGQNALVCPQCGCKEGN